MEDYDNFERSLDAYNTLLDDREARGEARGKAEGEKIKAREVVLKMHDKHLSIEDISEMVGLSVCEIAIIITENCS